MKWYDGGIAEAVTLSRKNGSIFVVYIEGADEKSKQLTGIVEAKAVSEVLGSSNFVAIKLEANSVPHQQFSEIYKQTSIPSIYFIGKTGTPLDIITEVNDAPEMLSKMYTAVIKNGGAPLKNKSEDLIKNEATQEVICDGDTCQVVPKAGSSQSEKQETPVSSGKQETPVSAEEQETPVSSEKQEIPVSSDKQEIPVSSEKLETPNSENQETVNSEEVDNEDEEHGSLTTEEKLKLAQDLIEKKRAQKKVEDEETERQKELERRKLGQDVLKMKRWQQEQEMKQLMEERHKEKREEQEARDKVKRQIEEDKREKAARLATANQHQQHQPAEQPKNISPRPNNAHTARLQFRLPDGTSHMHDFPSSSVLQEVMDYIKQNMTVGFPNFVLSTTFPRREFNENDANQSLLDLQLVPNAVVLVLPAAHGAVVTNTNSGIMGMVWYVLTPIFNFLGYVKELIFGKPAPVPAPDAKGSHENTEGAQGTSRPNPRNRAGESVIRRQGNIHRLTDRDSDDENNTWNGNSTQQM